MQCLYEWLRPTKHATTQRRTAVLGTCTWVEQTPEYQAWKASGYSKVLLIEGAPGQSRQTCDIGPLLTSQDPENQSWLIIFRATLELS